MNIFTSAALLLGSLTGLAQQFGSANGVQTGFGSGEYLASKVTNLTGDATAFASLPAAMIGRQFIGSRLRNQLDLANELFDVSKDVEVKKAQEAYQKSLKSMSIIARALVLVQGLELTTGFGEPYGGDDLKVGSERFTALYERLNSGFPDDGWQGLASQAYADRTADQQERALTIADLDEQFAEMVKDQADWVAYMRLGFGILKDLLAAAIVIELLLRTVPTVGFGMSVKFAWIVAGFATLIATGMVANLSTFSGINAGKANALAEQYTALAAGADSAGSRMAQAELVDAAESTAPSFEDISASMSGTSGVADGSRSAGGSGNQGARTGGGDGSGDDTSDKTGAKSTSGMPSLAQLTAMSGQVAKLSGHVSQQMNLVNQTAGQLQQLASMAQQARGAAAPIEEVAAEEAAVEEAPAETLHGAEAAVGTEGAERAPIEDMRMPSPPAHSGWRP